MQDQAASLRRLAGRPVRAPSFAFLGPERSGVTTLVAELGLALCLSGQRVLWVECCHGQQLAHRLNATTTGTLEGQLVRAGGLAEMMTLPRQGGALVNLHARPEDRAVFSAQLWLRLGSEFASLERDADFVLVNVPSLPYDPVPASVADNLVLVLTSEPESLTAAYAAVKRMALQAGRRYFNVLVNRVRSLEEAQALFTRLSVVTGEFLNVALRWVGFVPLDTTLRRSQALRRPLMEAFPECEAAMALGQLAATFPQWHTPEHPGPVETGFMDMLIAASRDWAETEGHLTS